MGRLLTLVEAAERINRPEQTLRYWVQQGTAPRSFKLGRRRMFREEDVEAWLNDRMAKSA